jgi:hypothetical protein
MAKLWFRAKRYGWGWTPATLEGWLVIAGFVALIVVGAVVYVHQVRAGADRSLAAVLFGLWVALLIGGVAAIGYAKGEPPRWRWGD